MALDNNIIVNYTDKTTIKNWFKTGLKPTQTQFWSTWDSYWHKSESLPISSISELGNLLDNKAELNHEHNQYATKEALDNEIVERARVDALKLNKPTENATNGYVLLADGSVLLLSEFGKVDTIDGIEADETKDVKLGAVRKTEVNNVTDTFTLASENNSSSVSFGNDGYMYVTGNVTYQMIDNEVIDIKNSYGIIANKDYSTIDPTNKLIYAQRVYVDSMQTKATNWTHAQQRMSALVSKHNDATYIRLMGMDAYGNINEVGIYALTNEMSKATDIQKEAWRVANRKTGETYSTGQPRVDSIAPFVLLRDSDMNSLTLIGENLFINNVDLVSRVTVIDSRDNTIVETCESISVHQTLPSRLSIEITKSLYTNDVPYYVQVIHNGISSIINTNAYFIIKETYTETLDTLDWSMITPVGQDNSAIVFDSVNPNNFSISKTLDKKLNVVATYDFDYNKNYYLNLNITTGFPNGDKFSGINNHTYLSIIDADRVSDVYQEYNSYNILYGGFAVLGGAAAVYNPVINVGNNKTHNVELYINRGICRIVNITAGINTVIVLPISSSGRYKLFLTGASINRPDKYLTFSVDVNSFSIQ